MSTRIPDVVVCTSALWEQVRARAGSSILDFEREEQAQRQQLEERAERLAARLREMGVDPDSL